MIKSNYRTAKTVTRVFTALSFTLFTAYQVYVAWQIPAQRVSRLIGVALYLFITVASFLALVHQPGIRFLRTILLVSGLSLLFIQGLFIIAETFHGFDFSNVPYILNCTVYIFQQLGILILLIYYLAVRTNKKIINKQKITVVLMTVVIVLFVSAMIIESILLIEYRINIAINLQYALIGIVLYSFGFIGTAAGFMFPSKRGMSVSEQYIIKEQSEADILVMSQQDNEMPPNMEGIRNPVLEDADIVFSSTENIRSFKRKR